jgi:hypothetical protein
VPYHDPEGKGRKAENTIHEYYELISLERGEVFFFVCVEIGKYCKKEH